MALLDLFEPDDEETRRILWLALKGSPDRRELAVRLKASGGKLRYGGTLFVTLGTPPDDHPPPRGA